MDYEWCGIHSSALRWWRRRSMEDEIVTLCHDPRLWPISEREDWDELAARIQFDGAGCTRAESERLAEAIVRRRAERGIVYPAKG